MRCEQFSDRINYLLDNRDDPGRDSELAEHAKNCPGCAADLSSWSRIELSLVTESQSKQQEPCHSVAIGTSLPDNWSMHDQPLLPASQRFHVQRTATWFVLAAAVCWMVFTTDYSHAPTESPHFLSETSEVVITATPTDFAFDELDIRVNEPQWWGEVAAATLRPVQPLAEGLRPLTNSFQSAVQILTPKPAAQPKPTEATEEDFSAQKNFGIRQTA